MALDTRWKNPQGGTLPLMHLWAQDLIKELRRGKFPARYAPVTKTANFALAEYEDWVINNKAGAACVVTLPAAGSYVGREVMFKNIQAQQLNSVASDVVPLAGGAAGTAILSANAGRWATLVSDGTNWVIMAGVI